ncbi:hypothetical protein PVAP13_6NG036700 [Panicum virgatum]|uniref:Uncharacterized protein n=1 Tax=Panicum virgatum TaxID=38727 RepID=A0A8T0QSV0_PANVG|nr:hypothetical protein PVAP13_6NG036700 [Panicum virgatum]
MPSPLPLQDPRPPRRRGALPPGSTAGAASLSSPPGSAAASASGRRIRRRPHRADSFCAGLHHRHPRPLRGWRRPSSPGTTTAPVLSLCPLPPTRMRERPLLGPMSYSTWRRGEDSATSGGTGGLCWCGGIGRGMGCGRFYSKCFRYLHAEEIGGTSADSLKVPCQIYIYIFYRFYVA